MAAGQLSAMRVKACRDSDTELRAINRDRLETFTLILQHQIS